ncbi:unnamed protein product [Lepidochelys olivacea]
MTLAKGKSDHPGWFAYARLYSTEYYGACGMEYPASSPPQAQGNIAYCSLGGCAISLPNL